MGRQVRGLLTQLNAAARAENALADATRVALQQHPDSAILTSFPGLGELPAARVLAEIGDDRSRFATLAGSKRMPAQHPSLAPAARNSSCSSGPSKTTG